MEKGKLVKILFAVIFGIIFVVSYSTVFNFGAPIKSASTTTIGKPVGYATGTGNAIVFGYTPFMNITATSACGNSSVMANVVQSISKKISLFQNNNSVSTFYPMGSTVVVESGTANTFAIYGNLYSSFNTTERSCINFTSGIAVLLPQTVTLAAGNGNIALNLSNDIRSYTFETTFSQNMSTIIPVKMAALLTANETLYGNLSVTELGR